MPSFLSPSSVLPPVPSDVGCSAQRASFFLGSPLDFEPLEVLVPLGLLEKGPRVLFRLLGHRVPREPWSASLPLRSELQVLPGCLSIDYEPSSAPG